MGQGLGRLRLISSKDNPTVKSLRALASDARELRFARRTLLDGPHLVEAYRRWHGVPELLVVNGSGSGNPEVAHLLAAWPDVEVVQLADGLFRELCGVASPIGIMAVISIPAVSNERIDGSCILLDAVQDSGNVGTIIRSAAAAGIREVILGRGCAGAWTPRVLRAAQGAHFSLSIREQVDLESLVRNYAGTVVATVAREGVSLFDVDLSGSVAWLFGNEGAGISAELVALARVRTTIPIAADTESLNVAAAAAVCLFEQVRQQHSAKDN